MTAALGAVLVALAAYVIQGTVQTTKVVGEQRQALNIDLLFAEARNAVAMQEVHLRHYEVSPEEVHATRFDEASYLAVNSLTVLATGEQPWARQDALRLRAQQLTYQNAAKRMMAMVLENEQTERRQGGPPAYVQADKDVVTPAFYTLLNDVEGVSRAYHAKAQEEVEVLRKTQVRQLIGTSVGFGIGLILVAMILRMVLGYQRRLVVHAAESRHQALHDPLTGMPNRAMFARSMDEALLSATSNGHQTALMIIDLDGFKAVNDTLGHQAGDQVLLEAGRRLTAGVGESGLVARLGGDEFAVLLPKVMDMNEAVAIGSRLVAELRRDFVLADGPAAISGSLGIALGPRHGTGDELFRNADAAMYRAKSSGGGVARHDAGSGAGSGLPDDLRALLESGDPDGQLRLYFQPQVRLVDGQVTSIEALARWQHPVHGLLMPNVFLPAAERAGLTVQLNHHLLDLAMHQAVRWAAAGQARQVSVNVAADAITGPAFGTRVLASLGAAGLPAELLRLEIAEASALADIDRTVAALREIRDAGVSISVDDFGAGLNSPADLGLLPVDELKIDGMFVRTLAEGSPDAALVQNAIALGHTLGLRVVAEGVEDPTVLAKLRAMGCDDAQGYALSRPVPADRLPGACRQAEQLLATH